MYLYRAIDSNGDTVEFYFSKDRDLQAAKRFIHKALARHGRPERITIGGSQTNRMAIIQCDAENRLRQRDAGHPVAIRSSKYLRMYLTRAICLGESVLSPGIRCV